MVDSQDGIRDPIGMAGVRLGVKVNLVTAATSCVQNVIRCAEHTSVIPVGGNNITSDIAAGLRTPMAEADRLKRLSGCALGRMVADDEEIEVPGVGGHAPRKTARRVLSDIIEPRVEEIFAAVRKRIEDTGMLEQLSAGVVLTGGAVLLQGMSEFAEEILGMPVRIGMPTGIKGITQLVHGPEYATGVGLVRYGAQAVWAEPANGPAIASVPPPRPRVSGQPQIEIADPRRSGFWDWVKAAF
jgi:cell division protein FtsA